MDYEVMRTCDGGRVVKQHVRIAGRTRGSITVRQETDNIRHRTILVARLVPASGHRPITPLYDAVLIGTSGERWMLAGSERIITGPLGREVSVGQSWIIEPVVVQDLIDVEVKWTNALREANSLREQLRDLTAKSARPEVSP